MKFRARHDQMPVTGTSNIPISHCIYDAQGWFLKYISLPRIIICPHLCLFPGCIPAHWQHFGYFQHANLNIKLDFIHMLYVYWINTIFLIIWDYLYFIPKHWLPFFSHKTLPLFHFTPFTLITTGLPYLASFVEWLPVQWCQIFHFKFWQYNMAASMSS